MRSDPLPVPVCADPLDEVLELIDLWVSNRERNYVCFANVHVLEAAQSDGALLAALRSGLVLPDGAPVAWLAGRAAGRRARRIPGAAFFEAACARDVGVRRHFLYGSTERTLNLLEEALSKRFPGIVICGVEAPPFRPLTSEEQGAAFARIDATSPDIVWVGLGAPRQELWMHAARPHLEAPILAGIGAAFDFASGTKARAPQWMQDHSLEWLHRMMTEPRRLTGRYVRTNVMFTLRLASALARGSLNSSHR
jgi:N-acetylglucosaminyldiphosphoundecaprenol N-acetyl-beta-D-mannosaminyltransferase